MGRENREGSDREGSEAFYFDGNGEEDEIFLGQGGEVGHVLDDGDFLLEENAVDGAPQILDVVDVMGIDAYESDSAVGQKLCGVLG